MRLVVSFEDNIGISRVFMNFFKTCLATISNVERTVRQAALAHDVSNGWVGGWHLAEGEGGTDKARQQAHDYHRSNKQEQQAAYRPHTLLTQKCTCRGSDARQSRSS